MNYRKLLFFLTITFISCTTVPGNRTKSVNYTDEIALSREITAIRMLIDTAPLEAFVRAKRLHTYASPAESITALYDETSTSVQKRFQKAVSEKNGRDSLRLFRSLTAAGKKPENWTESKIRRMQESAWEKAGYTTLLNKKTTAKKESASIKTLAKMLEGTATVWVDRGITIEKGLGRADRMIGSGFFIDKNGYLVTNYHVIQSDVDPEYEGYSRVYVKLSADSANRIPAKVVGWDPVFDLALLKTEITPAVYFTLGSSKDLKIGSKIYAMGSPAGLEQTLTSGIVSAQNRRFLSLGNVLQIDAPVNHGSSGGPIIDEDGRVQAVVFAGLEQQEGLNFAIPVELLKTVLPDLYAGGKVEHAWLGAYGETQKDAVNPKKNGVKMVYTLPASTADLIPQGSLITHINGIAVASLEDLETELMKTSPETLIVLSGWEFAKDNERKKIEKRKDWYIITKARPEKPSVEVYRKDSHVDAMLPLYGFYLETAGRKKAFRVKDVIQGSYADETGFSTGDYLEIRSMKYEKKEKYIYTQIYAKRKGRGYLDAFMALWAYLDSPSYF